MMSIEEIQETAHNSDNVETDLKGDDVSKILILIQ